MQSKAPTAPAASTRFQPPAYENRFVIRDQLINVLHAGRGKRLSLIHGPAGYGKTTLAVQWQSVLRAGSHLLAWRLLDRDDNDCSVVA